MTDIGRRDTLRRRAKGLMIFFVVGLTLAGLTAFPLEWELNTLAQWLGAAANAKPDDFTGLMFWIVTVRNSLRAIYAEYPFIAYGTDWLAFAHLILAILFLGALRDLARNLWVVEFGLIACVLVIPTALICGEVRGIPFAWRLIDCSFGVFAFIPLWYVRQAIMEMASLDKAESG